MAPDPGPETAGNTPYWTDTRETYRVRLRRVPHERPASVSANMQVWAHNTPLFGQSCWLAPDLTPYRYCGALIWTRPLHDVYLRRNIAIGAHIVEWIGDAGIERYVREWLDRTRRATGLTVKKLTRERAVAIWERFDLQWDVATIYSSITTPETATVRVRVPRPAGQESHKNLIPP